MAAKPKLRCAIYTRKSSEEGLEQDYNSLHAQRDACEAYVKSQIGEGWSLLSTAYDDGGISGGTMERDGLRRLLKDIEDGKIDVVVVYKVDRLTRALGDFARIVEIFDKHGVSFVSVSDYPKRVTSGGCTFPTASSSAVVGFGRREGVWAAPARIGCSSTP